MNQNINQEFENHGWERMRALLDRDLPEGGILIPPQYEAVNLTENGIQGEDKKKRRWFIFFFLLTIGAASGFTWKYFQSKSAVVSVPSIVETPVSKDEKSNQNLPKNSESEKVTKYIVGISEADKTPFESTSKVSNFAEIKTEINVLNENNSFQNIENQSIKSYLTINSPIEQAQLTNNAIVINDNKNKEAAQAQDTNFTHNSEQALAIHSSDALDRLAFLPSFVLFENTELPIIEKLEIKPFGKEAAPIVNTFKKGKTHFGITGGVHTEGGLDGYQGGVFLSKDLSAKWVFNMGINYRSSSTQGDSLTFVQLVYGPQTGVTTSFNLANSTEIHLKSLQYLEMPMSISYYFNRKCSVFSGFKAAYLLNKSVTTQDGTKFYVVTSSLSDMTAASKNSGFVSNNSTNALGLNRWDGAVIGGLSYNISPKIAVSMRYDFGLKNILTKQNWTAYNRCLGINAYYQF